MTKQTSQQAQEQIDGIDRKINVVRWALHIRSPLINTLSARSWQDAWDRHPNLRAQETELFRQRGIAQQVRDEAINTEWKSQQRRTRARAA